MPTWHDFGESVGRIQLEASIKSKAIWWGYVWRSQTMAWRLLCLDRSRWGQGDQETQPEVAWRGEGRHGRPFKGHSYTSQSYLGQLTSVISVIGRPLLRVCEWMAQLCSLSTSNLKAKIWISCNLVFVFFFWFGFVAVLFAFETGSHIAWNGFERTNWLRMALNSCFSCL